MVKTERDAMKALEDKENFIRTEQNKLTNRKI